MKKVDFHTHIFPDKLAQKASKLLQEGCNYLYKPVTDFTLSGLLRKMDEWDIDISVVQPVVTKASQAIKSNDWSAQICSDRIIAFGGIYPHSEDYKSDIDYIVSLGLKGIKLHAEYQDFTIDTPEMLRLYDYAFSKGLIILQHAGFDPAYKPPFHSSPQQFAHILDEMKGGTMIAAHFGGHAQWDDVERYLVGRNIYLDTSMGFEYYPEEQFLRIVKAHGADKILFASDSPWSNAYNEMERLKKLPLSEEEKNKIMGENACRLLFPHDLSDKDN